ncbi:phosphomannomutase [Jatrophihabitans sp. GAS493]|uniref:phospho-sugar mutase n=1 Tax=Jatrophihabitans sp. GAS493 TaxID=1907575 RepID=UPI000BB92361|nr:phospho-sugar mutase [Jatrophihabitans sp. GAS493]SOD72010.1 phosphomannomutase [Jatrophihabitans sp. GAS493]
MADQTGAGRAGVDTAALAATVSAWIADEIDPAAAASLQGLIDAGDWAELADRFSGPLAFGTAGLRGPIRSGPNGMNRAVVRRTAAGIASWLAGHGSAGATVVIGYDARHGSYDFAHDSAGILAAAGYEVLVLPRPLPTPVLAFSVLHFGAAVGIMVTASHNPPQDNGYKVYVGDGAQIVPPVDAEIEAAIRGVGSVRALPLSQTYRVVESDVVDRYVAAVVGLIADGPRDVRIVHTAMHGVGTEVMTRVLAAAGFGDVIEVEEQTRPDPDFPTVAFPNPEEPGALDLALATAKSTGADVVIANDPDADRCGVAAVFADGWRMLRGDEVGVLLADALIRKGVVGTYATTIVSSSLLSVLAADAGVGYAETLTGFKWLSRAAPDLAFAYEEALGYAVAPGLVRDKDGVSAGLLVAELAASLAAAGSSLAGRLDELAEKYGLFATDQLSYRVEDLSMITDAMARLRAHPPTSLLGSAVSVEELLPATDGVRLRWASGRVVVRPSGTEPKLKAYLEVVVTAASAEESAATARGLLTRLRGEMSAALGLE